MKTQTGKLQGALPTPGLIDQATDNHLYWFKVGTATAQIYARTTDLDREIWRAAFGDSRKDFEYYRLIEETMTDGFAYRYLLLLDEHRNPIALQPLLIVDQDLVTIANRWITATVAVVRKIWSRFLKTRILLAGCLVGDHEPGVIAPANPKRVSELLAEALLRYARQEKISLVSLKDFPATLRDQLSPFEQANYIRLGGFPPLVREFDFASFEEYMETKLSRPTRKNIRRKLRRSDDLSSPIIMEVLTDCSDVIDEIYPMYLDVARRAPVDFEIFSREYFLEAGRRMPNRFRYFIWRLDGRIIAFSFCSLWENAIYDHDIGFDYQFAHELCLYHRTYHDVIEWALANGLTAYHCGPFNYDPKAHLRMKLLDVDLYLRHTSGVINALLKWIAPRFAPIRSDPVLRQHYEGGPKPAFWQRAWNIFINPWLQIAINAVVVTISELFLKTGAKNTAHLSQHPGFGGLTGLASIYTWLGIICVIVSLIGWLYVLRHIPLSIAFPLSNAPHVLVPLSSWIFLGEGISPTRWIGIVLVLIGLFVVAKPFTRMEEHLDEKL